MWQIRLQVVRTGDDDGTKAGTITAAEVSALVNEANTIFAAADVSFDYDPARDFFHLNSTLINQTLTALVRLEDATDPDQEPPVTSVPNSRARRRLSEMFPDRLLVMFSHKSELKFDTALGHWVLAPNSKHSSSGHGYYVSMKRTAAGRILAHELGHFFQNRHTFGSQPETLAEAATSIRKYVDEKGNAKADGLNVFDGDANWVRDSPPDPGKNLFVTANGTQCSVDDNFMISVTFADGNSRNYSARPDRSLIMSYFDCPPMRLSDDMAWRARDTVQVGLRHRLVALSGLQIAGTITRRGDASAGAVDDVAMVAIGSRQLVTAVRAGDGTMRVIAWSVSTNGNTITRQGTGNGGAVSAIAACYAGLGLVITAVRTASANLKLIAWRVEANGSVVRCGDATGDTVGTTITMCRPAMEIVVTAAGTADGTLALTSWRVTASGTIKRLSDVNGGPASRIAVCDSQITSRTPDGVETSSVGQVTTAVRRTAGTLEMIHWQVSDDEGVFTKQRTRTGGAIDDVALSGLYPSTVVSAVRGDSGSLKLIGWFIDEAGETIDRYGDVTAGAIDAVAMCPAGRDLVVTAVRTAGHDLKLILWQVLGDGAEIVRRGDVDAGGVSRVALCQVAPGLLATAVRDRSGELKVIAWRVQ